MNDTTEECKLLDGPFAVIIQGVLFFSGLAILVLKRSRENPKRTVKVWAFDVSKQGVSSVSIHLVSMVVATGLSVSANAGGSECAWYFVTFLNDVTVGTLLSYGILKWVQKNSSRVGCSSLSHSGDYGDPPKVSVWLKQALSWTIICIIARLTCAFLIYLFAGVASIVTLTLDGMFRNNPHGQLTFVMVLCPVGLNLVQLWVQDTFLKDDQSQYQEYAMVDTVETELEPLSELEFYEEIGPDDDPHWGG